MCLRQKDDDEDFSRDAILVGESEDGILGERFSMAGCMSCKGGLYIVRVGGDC